MAISIRQATTRSERQQLFQFRYKIYVEEMGREQEYADHARRTIEEPLDEHGKLMIATDGDQIVGTIRYNRGTESDFFYYADLYRMREFEHFFPTRMSITTKLMVLPEYRRSLVPLQLAKACFRLGINNEIRFDIIDCNPPLKLFFEKLGYRQVFRDITHHEYGTVVPMLIALLDLDHLRKVRSPFLKLARTVEDEANSVEFFEKRFSVPQLST